MKLLIETAIIFFGTLLAAALLALGDPESLLPAMHGTSAHGIPAASVVAEWNPPAAPAQPQQ